MFMNTFVANVYVYIVVCSSGVGCRWHFAFLMLSLFLFNAELLLITVCINNFSAYHFYHMLATYDRQVLSHAGDPLDFFPPTLSPPCLPLLECKLLTFRS